MRSVVLSESDPYILLYSEDGEYYLHLFDGEVTLDVKLEGDPTSEFDQIALFTGDY